MHCEDYPFEETKEKYHYYGFANLTSVHTFLAALSIVKKRGDKYTEKGTEQKIYFTTSENHRFSQIRKHRLCACKDTTIILQ